jgi:aryl-alcohol dehydrogenase-like predicted oxidoreductase
MSPEAPVRKGLSVHQRELGAHGLVVSALGLGCMGMSQAYGPRDDVESAATLHRALDLGITLIDTAVSYGMGHNERLIGSTLSARRDEFTLASKFGIVRTESGTRVDGSPANARACCEESLRRLNTDHIDLYYLHRVDPAVPIEESVGAMAELVAAGKVRYLGLSEANADSLERAAAVHPISALQSEWSLWSRDIEDDIIPAARRLGVGLVPYGPLGQGFLTGAIRTPDDFGPDDMRRNNPHFQGENFAANLELVAEVRAMAAAKGVTPGQLALAWLLAQGPDVVPIPGTKRRDRLEENVAAAAVALTAGELVRLEEILPAHAWSGERPKFLVAGSSPARR